MQPTTHRNESQPVFILALVFLLLFAIGRMLEPFVGILLGALLVYVLLLPTYRKFQRKTPKRSPMFHAAVGTLFTCLFLLLPLTFLGWIAADQAREIPPAVKEWNDTLSALKEGQLGPQLQWMRPVRAKIADFFGMSSYEAQAWMIKNIRPALERLDTFIIALARNVLGVLGAIFFFLIVLFFLFKDAPAYYRRLRELLPLETPYQDRLFDRIDHALHVILRGWFLTAILQGSVATIGFLICRLPGAVLLGVLAAITSIVPYFGTSLVWGPAVIVLLIQGSVWKAAFLFGWGAGMVGMIDNLAAPWLMGQRIHMPLPILLFSILGGIGIFGFKGLLLGPLIVSVAPTVLEIYRERFLAGGGGKVWDSD